MGASVRGYHFISEYRNCGRKWYLHNICNLEPVEKNRSILSGSALHAAKEVWYKEKDDAKARAEIGRYFAANADTTDPEIALAARKLGEVFDYWLEDYGLNDLKRYDILAVEQELPIRLIGDIHMTGTLDLIVQDKETKDVLIFDTKWTGFSPKAPAEDAAHGDQATAYIAAFRDNYPIEVTARFGGFYLDVAYNKGSVIELRRSESIYRSEQDLERFRRNMLGLHIEIDQKLAAIDEDDVHPDVLFPRCGEWCAKFGCPYSGLCRGNIQPGDSYPGFTPTAPQGWRYDSPWRDNLEELRSARPLIFARRKHD